MSTMSAAQSVQQGWKCPECGQVNAPFIPMCTCSPVETDEYTGNKAHMKKIAGFFWEQQVQTEDNKRAKSRADLQTKSNKRSKRYKHTK